MILGVGIDILHLPRLQRLVTSRGFDKLAKRILTDAERHELADVEASIAEVHAVEAARLRYLAVRSVVWSPGFTTLWRTARAEAASFDVDGQRKRRLTKLSTHITSRHGRMDQS